MHPGQVTGIRWWRDPSNTDTSRTANLWSFADDGSGTGTLLASAPFGTETSGTWNTAAFASPVPVAAYPAVYCFSVSTSGSYFMSTSSSGEGGLDGQDLVAYPLRVLSYYGVTPNGNGLHAAPGTMPDTATDARLYGIDVVFTRTAPGPPAGPSYYSRWADSFPPSDAFFPIAVFDQDPATAADLYRNVGVNTFCGLPNGVSEPGALAAAASAGMYAMGGSGGNPADPEFVIANPSASATFAAYVLGDELDSTTPTAGTVVQGYAGSVRAIDPARPMYLNFAWPGATLKPIPEGLGLTDLQEQFGAADIVSCDFYALTDPYCSPQYPGIWCYGRQIGNMRDWVDDLKPVWGIIETGDPWLSNSGSDGTYPTNAQIAQGAWMMLIHGARGLIYFDHQFMATTLGGPDDSMLVSGGFPAVTAAVTALNAQITSLAPALNAPEVTGRMLVNSSDTTQAPPSDISAFGQLYIPWGRGPGVQVDTTVRQPGDGSTYIFAIAGNPGTTTGTFFLTGPEGPLGITGATVTVLGENRTIPVIAGAFTDDFTSGYQYHLYQAAGDNGGPVSYESVVLADSPAFLWLLNETSGSAAADATGNGNAGVYGGTYTQGAPGPLFQALAVTLDGSSGAVHSGAITNYQVVSAECWFKTSSASGGGIVMQGSTNFVVYMTNDGKIRFGIWDGSSTQMAGPASAAYNDGNWHYLVATYSNVTTSMYLYIDSVQVATHTSSNISSGDNVWRSGDGGNSASNWPGTSSSDYLAGTFADMAVYPAALTQTQVTAHYAASGYDPAAGTKYLTGSPVPALMTAMAI